MTKKSGSAAIDTVQKTRPASDGAITLNATRPGKTMRAAQRRWRTQGASWAVLTSEAARPTESGRSSATRVRGSVDTIEGREDSTRPTAVLWPVLTSPRRGPSSHHTSRPWLQMPTPPVSLCEVPAQHQAADGTWHARCLPLRRRYLRKLSAHPAGHQPGNSGRRLA